MSTSKRSYHFQLAFRHSAYAICSEVGVSCLNAAKTAQIFITLLLPLRNQVLVSISFFYTVIVEFCKPNKYNNFIIYSCILQNKLSGEVYRGEITSADCLSFVKKVENVAAPLVMKSEYWPKRLDFPFTLMRLSFSCETQSWI